MERLKSELFYTITIPYSFLKCRAWNNTPQNAITQILAPMHLPVLPPPADVIALLNALIILLYIISLSRNVPGMPHGSQTNNTSTWGSYPRLPKHILSDVISWSEKGDCAYVGNSRASCQLTIGRRDSTSPSYITLPPSLLPPVYICSTTILRKCANLRIVWYVLAKAVYLSAQRLSSMI